MSLCGCLDALQHFSVDEDRIEDVEDSDRASGDFANVSKHTSLPAVRLCEHRPQAAVAFGRGEREGTEPLQRGKKAVGRRTELMRDDLLRPA